VRRGRYTPGVHVLAIDQGTSATKALVVAPDGTIVARAEVAVHPRAVGDGGVEQDPEELWHSVVGAGQAALRSAGVAVGAVGLANQGETVLAWDRASGRPLSPALSWQDRRAATVCARLAPRAGALAAISGVPLDPYFAAPKMTWLREQGTRDGVVTTTDAWLVHRLTGAFVTDAATASRTALLDLDAGAWSDEACAAFAIPRDALPGIVDCAGPVGTTAAFGGDVPVTGLAVDQQAALFAEGCLAPGDAKCTYGTGAFVLATTGTRARRSRSGLAACIAWRLGGVTTHCLDGQIYTAGAAISWLERLGLLGSASELDTVAGAVPSADGVVFVPALAGLAAPFWQPAARGTFVGLGLATDRGHLVRAVLDGVAAQVALLAAAVESDLGTPLRSLRVDGGLTRSRVLLQTQADLLQRPVEVYPSPDATALGVAALARIGAGAAASAEEAIGSWQPAAVYEPRMSPAEAAERLARWRRVAETASRA
jgi:glycerol kinase